MSGAPCRAAVSGTSGCFQESGGHFLNMQSHTDMYSRGESAVYLRLDGKIDASGALTKLFLWILLNRRKNGICDKWKKSHEGQL